MTNRNRLAAAVLAVSSLALLSACGGGSGGTTSRSGGNTITGTASNVASVAVNAGPGDLVGGTTNTAFVSVNVCTHGTSTCQTLPFVAVDTGSAGLRILKSKLTVSLTQENDTGGNPIFECNLFVDGFTWGPVQTADVTIAGTSETATNIPVQIVDDSATPAVPPSQSCAASSLGGSDNSLSGLGAYAILGVGNFRQDCGFACTLSSFGTNANPGIYYSCPTSNCTTQIPVSFAQQLQNPVALFPTDNNGSILELPAVSTEGASLTGSLVFGIGTQSNNATPSPSHVILLDSAGTFVTLFSPLNQGQQQFPGSFLDSGSNGYFFLDNSYDPRLVVCASPNQDFYCPTNTLSLNVSNTDDNGLVTLNSTIKVANANGLPNNAALDNLGGPNINPNPQPGQPTTSFDFGLPFFYGRNVYTALEGVSNGAPTDQGQYVSY